MIYMMVVANLTTTRLPADQWPKYIDKNIVSELYDVIDVDKLYSFACVFNKHGPEYSLYIGFISYSKMDNSLDAIYIKNKVCNTVTSTILSRNVRPGDYTFVVVAFIHKRTFRTCWTGKSLEWPFKRHYCEWRVRDSTRILPMFYGTYTVAVQPAIEWKPCSEAKLHQDIQTNDLHDLLKSTIENDSRICKIVWKKPKISDIIRVSSKYNETCSICWDVLPSLGYMPVLCNHVFCYTCISNHIGNETGYKCPCCRTINGSKTGSQPDGTLTISRASGWWELSFIFKFNVEPPRTFYRYLPYSPDNKNIINNVICPAWNRGFLFKATGNTTYPDAVFNINLNSKKQDIIREYNDLVYEYRII